MDPARAALVVLCGAVIAAAAAAPALAQLVESTPPPGFAAAAAPRPAVVDIWFDGARVGTTNALLAPGRITFDDPRAVAELLPGAIDVAAVAEALRGPLATHAERLCGPGAPPDCGLLEPTVAGVVVDAASFRVDVFVDPAYRAPAASEARYVPVPGWAPSLVQSVAVAASSVPDADTRATLAAGSTLASGPARVIADYGFELDDGAFIETLSGQVEYRRWRGEAGLARASVVPLLRDRRFTGARLATTLDTRLDRDAARARPIVVTLARRSQVEILRDGRLLSVQTVPAGTSGLDTTALPVGAYDVTLRIAGPTGVREERRFVVKSAALPPADAPEVTLEAGVLAEEESRLLPALGDTPFVHGAVRYRLSDTLGAGPDLAVTPREAVASLRALGVWPGVEATADVFAGSDGAAGAGIAARGRLGGLGYAVRARRITGDPGPGTIDTRDRDDDDRFVPGRELQRLTAFAENVSEFDLSLSYQPGAGPRLGLRGFWRRADGRGETYALGPNLFWPLGRRGDVRLDLLAEAAITDTDDFVFARLRVSFDAGPWRSRAEGGYRAGEDGGASGAAALARDVIDRTDHRLRLAGRVDREGDITSLGGSADYRGRPGRLLLTATRDLETGDDRLAAQAGTTVALGTGGLGVIGGRGGASALVVQLATAGAAAADTVFEVVVDDRARRRLRPGSRAAVPLAAYAAYRVRLKQVEGPLVAYDGRPRTVSLYPGSVATERWTVRPLVTVFARLVDRAGTPLAGARLDTRPPAFTDAGGWFQAELGAGRPELTASVDGRSCRLQLPELVPNAGYRRLGDVPCRSLDSSS
jgi:hypothetical protein